MALRHHPDRNPEAVLAAEQCFKELNAAYAELSAGPCSHGRPVAAVWSRPTAAETEERLRRLWSSLPAGAVLFRILAVLSRAASGITAAR